MVAITNYDSLVQAIKDEAENDGLEFANFIPIAIDLAEERLFREIDLPELETKATGSLTNQVPTVTKPQGYEFAEHFVVSQGTSRQVLKKKKDSYIIDYWPNTLETGFPKYYGDSNQSTFVLAPTPGIGYTYEIRYTQKPIKLGVTNQTNYFVTHCKDALFFASMMEMAKFMKAWNQVQVFEQDYAKARESLLVEALRYRKDGEQHVRNPDNTTNSLANTISKGVQ